MECEEEQFCQIHAINNDAHEVAWAFFHFVLVLGILLSLSPTAKSGTMSMPLHNFFENLEALLLDIV